MRLAVLLAATAALLGGDAHAFVAAALPTLQPTRTRAPRARRPAPRPIPRLESAETVRIKTEDNLVLRGDFYPPRGSSLAPAAVLIHAAGSNRQSLASYAERLQKQGFGVLALDIRGHGESATGDHDWSHLSEEDRAKLWSYSTRDVAAAADFLRQQKGVHTANLSLVAHGSGGTLAAHHAAKDTNVRALAMLAPAGSTLGFDFKSDLESLEGLPTLIAVSSDDRPEAESLAKQAEEANYGEPFIEIKVTRSQREEILSDGRLPTEIAKWLKDKTTPKKGRGR